MIKFFRNKDYINGKLAGTYTYWSARGFVARVPTALNDMPKVDKRGVTISYNISCTQVRISFWEYVESKFKEQSDAK